MDYVRVEVVLESGRRYLTDWNTVEEFADVDQETVTKRFAEIIRVGNGVFEIQRDDGDYSALPVSKIESINLVISKSMTS